MAIHQLPRAGATRHNRLAACLATALAIGGGVAAGPAAHSANAPWMRIDFTLFEAIYAVRMSDASVQHRAGTGTLPAAPMSFAGVYIPVENCEDDGSVGSLRQVVAVAQDGDVIDLSALTCPTITLQSAIAVEDSNLTVLGPGQNNLTVNGKDTDRIFDAQYGMTISDLTIAHGTNDAGFGGCVRVNGDLNLIRSTVTECRAGNGSNVESFGGGVSVGGNLHLQSSTITASSATASNHAYGGGAYVAGVAFVDNSTIAGNSAVAMSDSARGAGLFARSFVPTLNASRVLNNIASSTDGAAAGGGISFMNGVINVSLSTISGNTAHSETKSSYGGGIHGGGIHDGSGVASASVMLTTSTLSGNTASANCADCLIMGGGASTSGHVDTYYSTIRDNEVLSAPGSAGKAVGGGLATFAYGNRGMIKLMNSTVSGNSASGGETGGFGYGGGIAAMVSSPFLAINSTIACNRASHFGGGATGSDAGGLAPILLSTIVTNNEAPDGADLASGFPFTPFTISGSANMVTGLGAGITVPFDTLDDNPHLRPLTANGGLTATHALAAGSVAIDAGSNNGFIYDQRRDPYARGAGSAVDIGAFEVQGEISDYIFRDDFDGASPCL